MKDDKFAGFWDNVENKSLEHKINNWLEQNKKQIRRLSVTLISVIPLAILYIELIFKPVNQALINYEDQGIPDPVIILSLVAFVFMSLYVVIARIGIWLDKLIWKLISRIKKEKV